MSSISIYVVGGGTIDMLSFTFMNGIQPLWGLNHSWIVNGIICSSQYWCCKHCVAYWFIIEFLECRLCTPVYNTYRMSSVVTPCIDAGDVLASTGFNGMSYECAGVYPSWSHNLLQLDDVTGWWGLIKEMNNWLLSPLITLVLSTYMVLDIS